METTRRKFGIGALLSGMIFNPSTSLAQIIGNRRFGNRSNVIWSTDFCGDADDIGNALQYLYAHAVGLINLIGISINSKADAALRPLIALRTLLHYCKLDNIPTWQYNGAGGSSDASTIYNGLATAYLPYQSAANVGHIAGLRKALSGAANNSVIMINTGFATDWSLLLQDTSTTFSSLTGLKLVTQKVAHAWWEAGYFPSNSNPQQPPGGGVVFAVSLPEFNIKSDTGNSNYLVNNWPSNVPFTFVGDEVAGATASWLPDTAVAPISPAKAVYQTKLGSINSHGEASWAASIALLAWGGGYGAGFSYWGVPLTQAGGSVTCSLACTFVTNATGLVVVSQAGTLTIASISTGTPTLGMAWATGGKNFALGTYISGGTGFGTVGAIHNFSTGNGTTTAGAVTCTSAGGDNFWSSAPGPFGYFSATNWTAQHTTGGVWTTLFNQSMALMGSGKSITTNSGFPSSLIADWNADSGISGSGAGFQWVDATSTYTLIIGSGSGATVAAGAINGHSAVQFDGATALSCAALANYFASNFPFPVAIRIVLKLGTNTSTAQTALCFNEGNSSTLTTQQLSIQTTNAATGQVQCSLTGSSASDTSSGNVQVNMGSIGTTYALLEFLIDSNNPNAGIGSSTWAWINGIGPWSFGNSTQISAKAFTQFLIGAQPTYSGQASITQFLSNNSQIARIIISNGADFQENECAVRRQFNTTYGLSIQT